MIEGHLCINVQASTVELATAYCHQASCIIIAVETFDNQMQGREYLQQKRTTLPCPVL